MSKKTIALGDIFSINTPKGKAYLHYIYRDNQRLDLIRVLPGLYPDTPPDLEILAASEELFMIFFALEHAYRSRYKIVEKVGFYPAHKFKKPQYMRSPNKVRGVFLGWDIVDTDTLRRKLVKELTPKQKKLSPFGIWNDTLLIEQLVEGWSLEKWGAEW